MFVNISKMKNFLYIYIIGFLDIASLGTIMPAFNRRLRKFGATHFQITLLESLFSGFQLITGPIVGTLSDRYGRKPLLLLSMIFSVFAFFTMGHCNTYLSIAIIRLMLGCFKHTQMLGKSLIGDNVPKAQQLSAHGMLNSFISLSFMIAPVYGGYLSERTNGFYYLACSTSLLCAINVIIIALKVPTKKIETTGLKKNMLHHLKKVDWVEYWPLLFLRLLYTVTLSTLMVIFGFVLVETFKLSPSQVGYTISVNSSISVATGFAVAKLEPFFHKYNSFKKCFFSFILLFFGYVCLSFAPNFIIYMLCMVPISAAGTLIEVFLNQILSETCKDHNRGTLEGAMTSSISVARSITPVVAGLAMDLYGSSGPYLFAALAAFSAALLAKFYDGKIKRS